MEDERSDATIDNGPEEVAPAEVSRVVHEENRRRTPVTILFSDIKGSTSYFEQKGDIEGLAMLERHNELLVPCIEKNNGRLIKTIGDALMTLFSDPGDAVRAAVDMQTILFEDGRSRPEGDRIQVRIGIHTGLGLIRDNDVFGDVVNAAARVQGKSLPEQILITDGVVQAAQAAGYQVAQLERTRLEGKEELIDVYVVGWSPESTQRMIDDLQGRYEEQIREIKQLRVDAEEEFERVRRTWRAERRELHAEVERLEKEMSVAAASAREAITEDFRSELRFEVARVSATLEQAERELESAHERFETERAGYGAQIEALEKRLIEALEQVNNPGRVAGDIQAQVDERLARAKKNWLAQWEQEREQLTREIERLRSKSGGSSLDEARRLVQERLHASQTRSPAGEGAGSSVADSDSLLRERDQLRLKIESLEADMATIEDATRREVSREIRHRYDQRSEQAERIRMELEQKVRTLESRLESQEQSFSERVRHLEDALPEAQEAARLQTRVELLAELQARIDEAERIRAGIERRYRDEAEEWDLERSGLIKQLEGFEEKLEEAREMAFRRSSDPTIEELNRLRREHEEEFNRRKAEWEDERARLLDKLARFEADETS